MNVAAVPTSVRDAVNARILAISEDQLVGFQRDPLCEIACRSGVELAVVIERIRAMLQAGTIRRVRQTLVSTNLAHGALVAWQVPKEKLDTAFDFMFQEDPFSGHVVIRSTDTARVGSSYRLWTTLKVPQGYALRKHCEFLAQKTGAGKFVLLPAKMIFTLGVGHLRRRALAPGDKAEVAVQPQPVRLIELNLKERRILDPLKREFRVEEIVQNLWQSRAEEAGLSLEEFYRVAEGMAARGIVGRFSTFLEHVKPLSDGERVTRFNALFHWAVPPGYEEQAGREVARHYIMTHAYWREGGPEFHHVNIMGVAHGADKKLVLAHKTAIDEHLQKQGIPLLYTNVFWGGRSEIKPSEISEGAYLRWCARMGVDPQAMKP